MASLLAAASADGTLLPGEARDAVLLLFAAGFETTSGLIGNAVNAVLRHPEHRSAGPAALLAETLRWDSPVQLTERVCGDAGVTLVLGAANRDPARFTDPDRFDPARFSAARFDPRRGDRQALSFGAGPHYCLGAPLARTLATRVLDGFLRRFPGAAPAGEPVRSAGLALRGFASLPVALGTPGFPRSDPCRPGGTVGGPALSTKDEP
jgi:cytochrome P450